MTSSPKVYLTSNQEISDMVDNLHAATIATNNWHAKKKEEHLIIICSEAKIYTIPRIDNNVLQQQAIEKQKEKTTR